MAFPNLFGNIKNYMMIDKLIFLFVVSFGLTWFLVPLNIRFSRKYGFLDEPSARRIHQTKIPLAGGLSFALPIIMLQVAIAVFFKEFGFDESIRRQIFRLAIGSFLILVLGYFDDRKKCSANKKLIFQIGISILMFYWGFQMRLLTNPFGKDINLGILSFPLTIVWFLLVINAFNLIDGIDGLAAGVTIIVTAVLFAVGIMFSNKIIVLLSLILIGSNLAFLRFNFYPAKIFMGDTGSLFIGFNIAAISVIGSAQYKGITTMTLLIPIIASVIPLTDTFLAVFRRIKNRKNIFQADKEHLHHKMLELGFSQKTVAVISYIVTFIFGLTAFGFSFAPKEILLIVLLILIFILSVFIFIILKKGMLK